MSAVNESAFGFSGTEHVRPTVNQVSLLPEEEQRRSARGLQDATSLELAVLSQVVTRVTHEFNNILTVIMGYADIALQKRLLSETNSDDLMQIKRASERGASLVRHLLAFSEPVLERSPSGDCVA